jgi:hypothetical protein
MDDSVKKRIEEKKEELCHKWYSEREYTIEEALESIGAFGYS